MSPLLAAISWDPYVIGILSVVISMVMLPGSVYLLLATNTGVRLGFLLAWTGFFGYMLLLGLTWWIYAIGLIGDAPEWEVDEILSGEGIAFSEVDDVRLLPVVPSGAEASPADVPDDWRILDGEDPDRGEALSIANESLIEDPLITALFGTTASTADFLPTAAFQIGGDRFPSLFGYDGKPLGWFGTANHIVIQVQPATQPPPLDVNSAPPPRVADPDQPVLSVVLTRNQGNVRFPPFLVTMASGIAFGVGAWLLHKRDRELMAAHAAAA